MPLTLHLPKLLDALDRKPVVWVRETGPDEKRANDKARTAYLAPLRAKMHRAVKYLFDSGQDRDEETVQAVRQTAVNMTEVGLFHLPFPLVWIEDPYTSDDDPEDDDGARNFYLCEEADDAIIVRFFQFTPESTYRRELGAGVDPACLRGLPNYIVYPLLLRIDLTEPTDMFTVDGLHRPFLDDHVGTTLGEAIYAVKKFIVTLGTKQAIRERVEPPPTRSTGQAGGRRYSYTILRIPLDLPPVREGERVPTGRRLRCQLVAGYQWGKHTRPPQEQRWIEPYWRGDPSLGFAPPKLRKVG